MKRISSGILCEKAENNSLNSLHGNWWTGQWEHNHNGLFIRKVFSRVNNGQNIWRTHFLSTVLMTIKKNTMQILITVVIHRAQNRFVWTALEMISSSYAMHTQYLSPFTDKFLPLSMSHWHMGSFEEIHKNLDNYVQHHVFNLFHILDKSVSLDVKAYSCVPQIL